jgi:hypothetical protein
LLGKLSIPKFIEEIDEISDIGKKNSIVIKSNEIAYTELILLIDIKASSGKVRGFKTKDYPNGNGDNAWERLKNKYEPVSALLMVKLEKHFRELSLKRGQDPEV